MTRQQKTVAKILEVKEIIRLQPITAVPRSPEWIRGIVTPGLGESSRSEVAAFE